MRAAIALIERQVRTISEHWHAVCAEAGLGAVDRAFMWAAPYAFYGLPDAAAGLAELAAAFRQVMP